MTKKYAIGADIGGSHISTILVDMENGRMIPESYAGQNVDNQAPANEILNNWAVAIRKTILLNTFEAGCLVIGGNVSGAYPLFGPAFENALRNQNVEVKIMVSELMESAAMVGSARLLDDGFWGKTKPLRSKI